MCSFLLLYYTITSIFFYSFSSMSMNFLPVLVMLSSETASLLLIT